MTLTAAARDIAQAGIWVAVLSADDPVNAAYPWRLFTASGWVSTALMHAVDPPHRPATRVAETDPA